MRPKGPGPPSNQSQPKKPGDDPGRFEPTHITAQSLMPPLRTHCLLVFLGPSQSVPICEAPRTVKNQAPTSGPQDTFMAASWDWVVRLELPQGLGGTGGHGVNVHKQRSLLSFLTLQNECCVNKEVRPALSQPQH